MSIRLEALDFGRLGELRHLTYPAVWSMVSQRFASSVRAIATRTSDETAGLALALPGPSGQFELLSIHVLPMFRRMGFGTAMLRALEEDFRSRDYRLGVHFLRVDERDQGNARFFMAGGWSRPAVHKLICNSTMPQAFQTPWLTGASLPDCFEIVDWRALSDVQRATLGDELDGRIADDVNPFLHEVNCHWQTSVALVEKDYGAVRGWVITHQIDDGTLRWSCSFVQPRLQARALIRALWLEVAQRQRAFPSLVDFIFTVPVTEERMARFALRRMRPWLSGLAYACTTMKRMA
jgi:GNAT superfamily N-acetyltransferase